MLSRVRPLVRVRGRARTTAAWQRLSDEVHTHNAIATTWPVPVPPSTSLAKLSLSAGVITLLSGFYVPSDYREAIMAATVVAVGVGIGAAVGVASEREHRERVLRMLPLNVIIWRAKLGVGHNQLLWALPTDVPRELESNADNYEELLKWRFRWLTPMRVEAKRRWWQSSSCD